MKTQEQDYNNISSNETVDESIDETVHEAGENKKQNSSNKSFRLTSSKPFKFLRKIGKPRIYKLRGYTTTSRVDRKVSREQNKRLIRNFLIGAIFILVIAILLLIFNPLKDLQELFRMIGI